MLLFILLLVVIQMFADARTQLLSAVALALVISLFFWKLFSLVRKMDRESSSERKNYLALLGMMIPAFVLVFVAAIVVQVSNL